MGAVVFLRQNLIGGNLQKIELESKYLPKRGIGELGHMSKLEPQRQNVDLNPLSNVNIERLVNHLPIGTQRKSPRKSEVGSLILNLPPVIQCDLGHILSSL